MGFYPAGCTDNGAPTPDEEYLDTTDKCEGCYRVVEGLAEAYAHDDDADRLCDGCIAKFEGYRAAARLSLQLAGGAQ